MTQTEAAEHETVFPTASRQYEWTPPSQVDFAPLAGLDGLGQLEAMVTGKLPPPPVMSLVGMTGFHPERGRVVVEMPAHEFHYNPLGGVHGGVISTLLDTAAGCSVHSTLAVGEMYTSLDLTVKFLRPVTVASGLLQCEGKVIQRGRRTALAEAQLFDESGKLLAHATSSCMIFS
jgi:uncharacterized protein (TIGR00369 family)